MKEKLKKDYLNYLFFRTKKNLTRYHISADDSDLIKNIFKKLINSENPHASLFILYNIKEFKNLSKYMIFILKKLEDDVINFENLLFNLENDTEFLQNEILSYLSNPERKIINEIIFKPEITDEESGSDKKYLNEKDNSFLEKGDEESKNVIEAKDESEEFINEESETEESEFRKNYLELIQTEENETGIVYELPGMESSNPDEPEFKEPELDLPEEEFSPEGFDFNKQENTDGRVIGIDDSENDEIINDKDDKIDKDNIDVNSDSENKKAETDSGESEEAQEYTEISETVKIIKTIETVVTTEEENISGYISEDELYIEQQTGIVNNKTESGKIKNEKIQLSDEIQGELDLFDEYGEQEDIEDDTESTGSEEENSDAANEKLLNEINEIEPEPANTLFVEYESEIRDRNRYLNREFDSMINLLAEKSKDEEERTKIIFSIIETSKYLEDLSRKMSLEVISNIYQTITLSFEKISDAKYDITESTLNLFKKGLTLVISLINGDNYFGYKDILKSIENIRNTLIEEKLKRETYLKRLQEKMEIEKNLDKRYPDDTAKARLLQLKKYIKDTESNFKSLEMITGEYQIYEALRSLSGSLNNFKDIVKISKELKMMKLVKLSEAGYIFVKFLQNYRINPVTDETKEIFGYMIHNLKLLTMGRDTEDIDLFISYLNDPVKIFSNTENKNKTNKLNE